MNTIIENLGKIHGQLSFRVFENGEMILSESFENLVVDTGREAIAKLLGGDGTAIKEITNIGFGTNPLSPAGIDTSLANQFSKIVNTISYPAINQIQFDWSLELPEANGMVIREFGLLCADGALFSRKVSAAITKSDQLRLEGEWILTI